MILKKLTFSLASCWLISHIASTPCFAFCSKTQPWKRLSSPHSSKWISNTRSRWHKNFKWFSKHSGVLINAQYDINCAEELWRLFILIDRTFDDWFILKVHYCYTLTMHKFFFVRDAWGKAASDSYFSPKCSF